MRGTAGSPRPAGHVDGAVRAPRWVVAVELLRERARRCWRLMVCSSVSASPSASSASAFDVGSSAAAWSTTAITFSWRRRTIAAEESCVRIPRGGLDERPQLITRQGVLPQLVHNFVEDVHANNAVPRHFCAGISKVSENAA